MVSVMFSPPYEELVYISCFSSFSLSLVVLKFSSPYEELLYICDDFDRFKMGQEVKQVFVPLRGITLYIYLE